jgi:hypothetical protein
MKNNIGKTDDDMRPEYDFDYSKGVRGKYYKRLLKEGFSIVILDPDVAESFRDSSSVNQALRTLITSTHSAKQLTKRVGERSNTHYEVGKTRNARVKDATIGSVHLKQSTRNDKNLNHLT